MQLQFVAIANFCLHLCITQHSSFLYYSYSKHISYRSICVQTIITDSTCCSCWDTSNNEWCKCHWTYVLTFPSG